MSTDGRKVHVHVHVYTNRMSVDLLTNTEHFYSYFYLCRYFVIETGACGSRWTTKCWVQLPVWWRFTMKVAKQLLRSYFRNEERKTPMASTHSLNIHFVTYRPMFRVCKTLPVLIFVFCFSSAYDQQTNCKVAIKKLARPFQSAVHAKRTYREVRMLKHMNHENVSLYMYIYLNNNIINFPVHLNTVCSPLPCAHIYPQW